MKVLTSEERAGVVRASKEFVRKVWTERHGSFPSDTRSCLYDAVSLQVHLFSLGIDTMLQAGTTQWPFRRPEDDDGVSPTHFSHRWEISFNEGLRIFLITGALPEMHVWLAQRGGVHAPEDAIIDPTAGSWPERAAEYGYPWLTPRPPDFLWVTPRELMTLSRDSFPLGITYAPDPEACHLASLLAEQDIYPLVVTALKRRIDEGLWRLARGDDETREPSGGSED